MVDESKYEDIDELIKDEDDISQRSFLLTLKKMFDNQSDAISLLVAGTKSNADAISAISKNVTLVNQELSEHIKKEEKEKAELSGSYKIIKKVAPYIYAIGCSIFAYSLHDYIDFKHNAIHRIIRIEKHEIRTKDKLEVLIMQSGVKHVQH